MKDMGLLSGVADLCIIIPDGKVLWVELKAPPSLKMNLKTGNLNKVQGGNQKKPQKEFQQKCASLGHTYVVMDDFYKFVEFVNNNVRK